MLCILQNVHEHRKCMAEMSVSCSVLAIPLIYKTIFLLLLSIPIPLSPISLPLCVSLYLPLSISLYLPLSISVYLLPASLSPSLPWFLFPSLLPWSMFPPSIISLYFPPSSLGLFSCPPSMISDAAFRTPHPAHPDKLDKMSCPFRTSAFSSWTS